MKTREQLLKSVEYWFEHAQDEIYRQVIDYLEAEKITQTELANRLGVTKGYVSQILKGEFNYTLKRLIELSLAVGKVPVIEFKAVGDLISEDLNTRAVPAKKYALFTSIDNGIHLGNVDEQVQLFPSELTLFRNEQVA